MSWLFSRALVEEYLGASCSGGEQSVQSSSTHTPEMYLSHGKMTDVLNLSRFGMMCEPLTESRGAELLTWFLGAFHAKIFLQQERARELMGNKVQCGSKWHGSLAKYDQDSASWKTAQLLLFGGLEEFSETWPEWGIMRNGECWEHQIQVPHIVEKEFGLWPTPMKGDGGRARTLKYVSEGYQIHLSTAVWMESGRPHQRFLNPEWTEWLMGWPLGWTDMNALEMDKYQQWLDLHGSY